MSDMSQTQIKTNGTGDITGSSLHWADYLVIVGYFLAVLVVRRVLSRLFFCIPHIKEILWIKGMNKKMKLDSDSVTKSLTISFFS